MEKLKCKDCGQGFDGNLNECPNCGCPASECERITMVITGTSNSSSKTDWANKIYECGALFWETLTQRYFDFSGRASRLEYWSFILISLWFIATSWGLGVVVVFIPALAVTVRRLHDINRSGWWIFVPWVSFFFQFKKSDEGVNDYGAPYNMNI